MSQSAVAGGGGWGGPDLGGAPQGLSRLCEPGWVSPPSLLLSSPPRPGLLPKCRGGVVGRTMRLPARRYGVGGTGTAPADPPPSPSPPPPPSPRPGEFEEESKQPTMTEQQRHQLKHRELFLSRQFESLPATHIRCVPRRREGVGGLRKEEGGGCFYRDAPPLYLFFSAPQGEVQRDAPQRDRHPRPVPGEGGEPHAFLRWGRIWGAPPSPS